MSTIASATGATGAPTSTTILAEEERLDPTASAVRELLVTMQSTLGALGKTFDVLGDHTMRVAALGPAVHALYQVRLACLS